MSRVQSRGSRVKKSRVEGKSRGSIFFPRFYFFNIKFMELLPGTFQVTNYIVNGGNGGFLIEYRKRRNRHTPYCKTRWGGISKEHFVFVYVYLT